MMVRTTLFVLLVVVLFPGCADTIRYTDPKAPFAPESVQPGCNYNKMRNGT